MIKALNIYQKGWIGYFGFSQRPYAIERLDKWVRRRIRAYIWKQLANPTRRFAALRRLGVTKTEAVLVAASPFGPWRCSAGRGTQFAYTKAYLQHELGHQPMALQGLLNNH